MNNKLTDETLSAWKMEAKISLGETAKDGRDYSHHEAILALVTELQERRKADGEPMAYTTEFYLQELNKSGLYQCWLSRDARNAEYSVPIFAASQSATLPPEMPAHTGPRQDGRPQAYADGWNACRAAMLQGSQPVSNRDELREKVPSTQPAADLYALCWESGDVVAYTPDSEKAAIWLNNYSGTRVQEYVTLEQFQGVVSGNSPVTPDGWIKCSDRTPKTGQAVIGCVDFDSDIVTPLVREFIWTGSTFRRGVYSTGVKSNDSVVVTHWMPLPAAPKKD
ncbi:DUF551 domain-containing protein [Salmonella enterica subsp. enterica serovar Rovaniemi]|nr:DUF551 domain-containing protein [Salmonella enterica subsp. enterica serovar Rovaniemi]